MSSDKYNSDLKIIDIHNLNDKEYNYDISLPFPTEPPPEPPPLIRQRFARNPNHNYDIKLLDHEYHNTFNNDYNIFLRYYDTLNKESDILDGLISVKYFYFKIVCIIKVFNGEYDNIPDNYRIIDLILNDHRIEKYLKMNIYRILWDKIDTLNGFFNKPELLYGYANTYTHTISRYPLKLLERVFKKSPDYINYRDNIQINDNQLLYNLLYTDNNIPKLELLLNNPFLNIEIFIDIKICKLLLLKEINIKNIDQVKQLIFGFGLNGINIIDFIDFIIKQNYKKFDLIDYILFYYKRCLLDNEVIVICSKLFVNDNDMLVFSRKYKYITEILLSRLLLLKPTTYKKIMSKDLLKKIGPINSYGVRGFSAYIRPEELTKQFLKDDLKIKYLKYKNKYINLKETFL